MIFLTVGTERFQFNRLVKTMDSAVNGRMISQEVFAQIGSCTYEPKSFFWVRFIDFKEMVANIKKADIVISHAGVGSLLLCAKLGKIPILFPRKNALGEHIDDHQDEFVKKMSDMQKIIAAYNDDELIYKINNYNTILTGLKPRTETSKQELINYLKKIF